MSDLSPDLQLFHAWAHAMAELHRQAIAVCALLAGFSMASAYAASRQPSGGTVERLTTVCLTVSAMAFISVVCVASLYMMAFSHYEQLMHIKPDITEAVRSAGVFSALSKINFFSGMSGMSALLIAMGSFGYLRNRQYGFITALVSVIALLLMAFSVVRLGLSPLQIMSWNCNPIGC